MDIITPLLYMNAPLLVSAPFLSGGFAARFSREVQGKEWVID